MHTIIDMNGTPHKFESQDHYTIDPTMITAKNLNDTEYYILCTRDGDPFNPYSVTPSLRSKDRLTNELAFKLRKCSYMCYQYYVTFLRTKNNVDYICTRRSYLNG